MGSTVGVAGYHVAPDVSPPRPAGGVRSGFALVGIGLTASAA
ncbi:MULTISPECIES: hypothetical protein [Actinoalloteichus]|nr:MULTISPECIES: hypothetical protein [Actinoalloteichus]